MIWEGSKPRRDVPSIGELLKRYDELVPPTDIYLTVDESGNLTEVNSAEEKARQPGAIAKAMVASAASYAETVLEHLRAPAEGGRTTHQW